VEVVQHGPGEFIAAARLIVTIAIWSAISTSIVENTTSPSSG
jgi:hypothetical protein